jgi:hypothetical protein
LQSKHLFLSFCSLFAGSRLSSSIDSSTYLSATLTGVEVSAGDLATISSFLRSLSFLHTKRNTYGRTNRGRRRSRTHRIGSIRCTDYLPSSSNGLAVRSLIILTWNNTYIIKRMRTIRLNSMLINKNFQALCHLFEFRLRNKVTIDLSYFPGIHLFSELHHLIYF